MYPIIAALLATATPGDAGPLTASVPAVDRGEVRTGPPLAAAFELTHAGPTGEVTITGIDATCGCLQPTASRNRLRPGDRCQVTLVVNTLTQPAGPHTWPSSIRYRLDDGPEQKLIVKLSALLVREVAVEPPQVEISTAGTATQTITVTDRRAHPLTVLSATTTSPHLSAIVQPARTSSGLQSQPVELRVASDFPPGRSDETVVLTTTDPECRELRVPVRVTKRTKSDVAAYPDSLEIRFARGQAEASGLFQLRRPGGGIVRIESVQCSHPGLLVRWTAGSGPVATVRVIADVAKLPASGHTDLRVTFADLPGNVVTIPVAWIRP